MIRINGGQATLGANTFTGAQVAPSLALGGAALGGNALAVTGTTALGGSLLMGASTSITVASGGIVGVGFAFDQQAAGDISTKAAGRIGFSSTSNPSTAPDTAFSRISAGIIGVGTGAAGSVAGSMQMSVLDFGPAGNAGVKWGASSLGLFNNSNNVLAVRNSTNSADASITAAAGTFSSYVQTTGTFLWASAGRITAQSDGVVTLLDAATTSFGRLQFGGTTSSYPALQRSGSTLQVLFADVSNWARIQSGQIEIRPDATYTAGGSSNMYIMMGSGGISMYAGSGAPTVSAAKGSLYLRSDGTGVSDRMYVNTNGSTTWTAVTTVA